MKLFRNFTSLKFCTGRLSSQQMFSEGEELVSCSLFRIIFLDPRGHFMCYEGLTLKTSFSSLILFVRFIRIS